MTKASDTKTLQQLLDLHAVDQELLETQRELRECRDGLDAISSGVRSLEEELESIDARLKDLRLEARTKEREVDEKREALNRLRSRASAVQTERQYSAATVEQDLVRRDLRVLENEVIDKLEAVENLEARRKEVEAELEEAREDAGPSRESLEARMGELEDQLAIQRDRRENLAIRLGNEARELYERIRGGKSDVVLAPVTEEGVCGNCFTAVTMQQQLEVKGMTQLVCCEGCGVILYPGDLD